MISANTQHVLEFFYEHLGQYLMPADVEISSELQTCTDTGLTGPCVVNPKDKQMTRSPLGFCLSASTPVLGVKSIKGGITTYNRLSESMYAMVEPGHTVLWCRPGHYLANNRTFPDKAIFNIGRAVPEVPFRREMSVPEQDGDLVQGKYPIELIRSAFEGKMDVVVGDGFQRRVEAIRLGRYIPKTEYLLVAFGKSYANLLLNMRMSSPEMIRVCSDKGVDTTEGPDFIQSLKSFEALPEDSRLRLAHLLKEPTMARQEEAANDPGVMAWFAARPVLHSSRALLHNTVIKMAGI